MAWSTKYRTISALLFLINPRKSIKDYTLIGLPLQINKRVKDFKQG